MQKTIIRQCIILIEQPKVDIQCRKFSVSSVFIRSVHSKVDNSCFPANLFYG